MKHVGLFISLFLVALCSSVIAQENTILGTWWNDDQTSHIRIFKATNGKFYGKVEYMKTDPDKLDINNPDSEKRKDPVLGLIILKNFSYDETKKQWNNGTVYDPDNGKTYDCFLWFDESTDLLHLKGYVMGMKFIGRETQWTRVKD